MTSKREGEAPSGIPGQPHGPARRNLEDRDFGSNHACGKLAAPSRLPRPRRHVTISALPRRDSIKTLEPYFGNRTSGTVLAARPCRPSASTQIRLAERASAVGDGVAGFSDAEKPASFRLGTEIHRDPASVVVGYLRQESAVSAGTWAGTRRIRCIGTDSMLENIRRGEENVGAPAGHVRHVFHQKTLGGLSPNCLARVV